MTRPRNPNVTVPWRLAGAADRRLMRRWTRRRPEPVDQLLMILTRTADHSLLWLLLAAAAASAGGERSKRAAAYGLVALGFSSATVNGPFKWSVGRRRPVAQRRTLPPPRTSSFPSGHSASAFAFASAARRELPEAGPLLLPLAAAVAYSRVYLEVHYPSDVVAGAAFGTAVGLATRPAVSKLGIGKSDLPSASARWVLSEDVLAVSAHAGDSAQLG